MLLAHAVRVIRSSLAALAIALAAPAMAQGLPVVLGEPVVDVSPKSAATSYLLTTEDEMPARRLRLADPAAAELSVLDEVAATSKRVMVGFGREVADYAVEGAGDAMTWSRVGEWRIAKIRVQSPGAKALRVGLRIGSTPEPWNLRVAGSDDESKALGPVRLAGPLGKSDMFWTPLTEGDSQVIEIASPAGQPEPFVEIATVSHIVASPSTLFAKTTANIGTSGSCNIDLKCVTNPTQALLNAANSVVQMLFTKGGSSYLCTGTLLNDTKSGTQIPYLYSANHCFENENPPYATASDMQKVADTLNTFFFFDAIACRSLATPPYVQRYGGATYLYSNLSQDILFLRLNEWAPTGAYLSGWDPNPITTGASVTILHHPWGDLKKWTTGTTGALTAMPTPVNASTGYISVVYNQGTAEPGSSGGGILTVSSSTGQYLLRGGLLGGEASCSARSSADYYSRFDVAYPTLRTWLEATSVPDFEVSDMWWNSSPVEEGWGINLTQHPSGQIFAVWYTYADDKGPLWLVMSGGQWTTSRSFTGKLYRTSGPAYSQPTFDPSKVVRNEVGTLTLNFTDANNGSFTWVVDGVRGTKSIKRLDF